MLAWQTVFSDGFESTFPGTHWSLTGNPTWDSTLFDAHTGSGSSYSVGSSTAAPGPYPIDVDSWMVLGPFDLSSATEATVDFWYRNASQSGADFFSWAASVDGATFHGHEVSGDQNTWRSESFDLTDVPVLGDLTGQSQVWIAFAFDSDSSGGDIGAFVDDVSISINSTADLQGNNAAGAVSVQMNFTAQGSINTVGDYDWFRIEATAGLSYVFTTHDGGLADSELWLFAANGTTQLRHDDDNGPGNMSQIAWTPLVSGTYYLAVSGYGGLTGGYSLEIAQPPPLPDDHGNNAATATPVAINVSTAGNIQVVNDVDWFSFNAGAGVEYVIETSNNGLGDSQMRLIDSNGTTQLRFDEDSGPGNMSRIEWTAPSAGTYYVEVSGYGGLTGNYGLTVSGPTTLLGDYNHDNTVNAADYTVYRNMSGQTGLMPYDGADGNGDGMVTRLDYDVWKEHYGETARQPATQVVLPSLTSPGRVASDYYVAQRALTPALSQRERELNRVREREWDAREAALLALFETLRSDVPTGVLRGVEFEPIDESAEVEPDAKIESVDAVFDLLAATFSR